MAIIMLIVIPNLLRLNKVNEEGAARAHFKISFLN
jgi:hypothetical protein